MSVTATSLSAYKTLSAKPLRDQILDIIGGFGSVGCNISDLSVECAARGICEQNSTITARIVELEDGGEIYRNGDQRVGRSGRKQLVIRHIAFVTAVPMVATKRTKNPFVAGMMFAAKAVIKADPTFKGSTGALALRDEIRKAAK